MQGEFGQASELMDQKYRQLNDRFIELQELYENRPSRPEDLEMIRQLEETIAQQEAMLKKAAEDMKFYKLELINREKSYNEMFGANPMVGFIEPRVAGGGKPLTGGKQMSLGGTKQTSMGTGGIPGGAV
jgi:restriction endonuclease S subunit